MSEQYNTGTGAITIDPSKVNLSEADIEEYLWQNPEAVTFTDYQEKRYTVNCWIKRQFSIPSGILDLFGETENGDLVVVEVKNVEVDARAVAQVCRYAYDMDIIMDSVGYFGNDSSDGAKKVVVGPSISTTALRECEACGVVYIRFEVTLSLETNHRVWTNQFLTERIALWRELAKDQFLREVAQHRQAQRAHDDAHADWIQSEKTKEQDAARQSEEEEKAVSDLVDEYLEGSVGDKELDE